MTRRQVALEQVAQAQQRQFQLDGERQPGELIPARRAQLQVDAGVVQESLQALGAAALARRLG